MVNTPRIDWDFISIVKERYEDGLCKAEILDLGEDEIAEVRIGNIQLKNDRDKVHVTIFNANNLVLNTRHDYVEGTIHFDLEG